jgi:phage terminase small subunit
MELVQSGELYQYDADNLPEIEPKQARFVKELCIDLNGRKAAIRAGYPISNADYMASVLRHDPKVSAHIEAALAAADVRTGMNIDRARRELAKLALANPAKVVAKDGSILDNASDDDLAAIQSIKVKCVGIDKATGKPMYEREIRFHDKIKATELYARLGNWLVEKKEVNVTTKAESMTPDERKAEIDKLLREAGIMPAIEAVNKHI